LLPAPLPEFSRWACWAN